MTQWVTIKKIFLKNPNDSIRFDDDDTNSITHSINFNFYRTTLLLSSTTCDERANGSLYKTKQTIILFKNKKNTINKKPKYFNGKTNKLNSDIKKNIFVSRTKCDSCDWI